MSQDKNTRKYYRIVKQNQYPTLDKAVKALERDLDRELKPSSSISGQLINVFDKNTKLPVGYCIEEVIEESP